MLQNKLTLALTLISAYVYAQDPVDLSHFVYDAVIAADCVRNNAPEDVCAQLSANIALMMSVGAAQQEKVNEVLNEAPASNDENLADLVRVEKLRKVIKDAAAEAQPQYDNGKVFENLWVTKSIESTRQAMNEQQNVEDLYFKVLLKHMASDSTVYHKIKRMLNRRTHFLDDLEPLKASQNAFFATAKAR
jgi:E3 ubiquitin-protein ligase DOA10